MAIKNAKQFRECVDGAFETMKTRDEAKAGREWEWLVVSD